VTVPKLEDKFCLSLTSFFKSTPLFIKSCFATRISSIVISHPMISMIDGKPGRCVLVHVLVVVSITRSSSRSNPKSIPVRLFSFFSALSPILEDDTDDDDDDDDDDDGDENSKAEEEDNANDDNNKAAKSISSFSNSESNNYVMNDTRIRKRQTKTNSMPTTTKRVYTYIHNDT